MTQTSLPDSVGWALFTSRREAEAREEENRWEYGEERPEDTPGTGVTSPGKLQNEVWAMVLTLFPVALTPDTIASVSLPSAVPTPLLSLPPLD